MIVGAWEKCTLIDFPGKIATTIFTQGCNFRCPFCHNGDLLSTKNRFPIPLEEIFQFLERRRGQLEGVVLCGGEPTSQRDLSAFLRRVKSLGYATKLDTNGSHPATLKSLNDEKLLDFIAIDLKHVREKYDTACGHPVDVDAIFESVAFLKNSSIDHELRTTVVPGLHTLEDIRNLVPLVRGAKRFTLQNFLPTHALNGEYRHRKPFDGKELEEMRSLFAPVVGLFSIR
jgi:pyruvate formate lyase activating enzyme